MLFDEGDTDVDAIGRYDQKGSGPPIRIIGASWDLGVPAPHWPAFRAAAAQGQAAFDLHIAGAAWVQPEAKALYASMDAPWREAARRGTLGLAP